MNTIFLPIFFVCYAQQCGFIQSDVFYYSLKKCEEEISREKEILDKQQAKSAGVCVQIQLNKNET